MTVRARSSRLRNAAAPLVSLSLGAACALAGCGLLGAPGGYSGGDDDGLDGSADTASPPDAAPADTAVTLPDGNVVPGSIGTLAVVAGERDPTSADDDPAWSADAWSGVLDDEGRVSSWRIEKSAPVTGSIDSSGLVGTTWMMIDVGFGIGGGRGTALQSTSWGPGFTGAWVANGAFGYPGGLAEATRTFFGAHLAYVGGTRTVAVDGGTNTFYANEIHTAPIDASKNTLGPSVDGAVQLLHARARPAVAIGKDRAYVVGGRVPGGGFTGSVEMAPIDTGAGTFQAFVDQPSLTTGGAEHKVQSPAVALAGGFLFVAGGRAPGNGPTDVVLAAPIDGVTGTVGDFKTLTKLPAPLRDHAFVAFKDRLYVVGGVGATTRSDAVYSARIAADGTIGAWDTDAKLPGARSSLAALAY
ncbi:MAG: hypothetical protein JWP97_136 [Labilithrix sp.]|nr:hypothetical protein [Labilithrix sp.]